MSKCRVIVDAIETDRQKLFALVTSKTFKCVNSLSNDPVERLRLISILRDRADWIVENFKFAVEQQGEVVPVVDLLIAINNMTTCGVVDKEWCVRMLKCFLHRISLSSCYEPLRKLRPAPMVFEAISIIYDELDENDSVLRKSLVGALEMAWGYNFHHFDQLPTTPDHAALKVTLLALEMFWPNQKMGWVTHWMKVGCLSDTIAVWILDEKTKGNVLKELAMLKERLEYPITEMQAVLDMLQCADKQWRIITNSERERPTLCLDERALAHRITSSANLLQEASQHVQLCVSNATKMQKYDRRKQSQLIHLVSVPRIQYWHLCYVFCQLGLPGLCTMQVLRMSHVRLVRALDNNEYECAKMERSARQFFCNKDDS